MRSASRNAFAACAGHNHISEVKSIDTKDDRLGAAIREFLGTVTK
jgi:hypothetical protein